MQADTNQTLDLFYFNLETLNLLVNENDPQLLEIMEEAEFEKELSSLLKNMDENYLNSVLVRLKYFMKDTEKNERNLAMFLEKYNNFEPLFPLLKSYSLSLVIELTLNLFIMLAPLVPSLYKT